MATESEDRIGIVIPVPEPRAALLRSVRAAAGDPFSGLDPHLTLVTGVAVADWDVTLGHVRSVAAACAPFNVLFEGSATFRPVTPVVYAAISEGAEDCVRLHQALQAGPLDSASEYPYVPHVTLAQNVPDAALDAAALSHSMERWWLFADSVVVYASHGDQGDWSFVESVPLGG